MFVVRLLNVEFEKSWSCLAVCSLICVGGGVIRYRSISIRRLGNFVVIVDIRRKSCLSLVVVVALKAGVKFLLASSRGGWVEVEVVAVEEDEASIEQIL
ncbi:1452_t:CDS:2 [Dentiscutata erythropus]|uniref:1452_t:CDS:1 n=1 Tax=Dentiscutata erythropus TaxID=1348616 RepID=A0A9N8ZR79_9GLOM|nr:1452_t:CDS:2 [Dentiscutata erythropus]